MPDHLNNAVTWPPRHSNVYPNLRVSKKPVAVQDLTPFQIDYTLSYPLKLPPIVLDYTVDLQWAEVRFRCTKALWRPTEDREQAMQAIQLFPSLKLPSAVTEIAAAFRTGLVEAGCKVVVIPHPHSYDK